jgi:hypothetical protein
MYDIYKKTHVHTICSVTLCPHNTQKYMIPNMSVWHYLLENESWEL